MRTINYAMRTAVVKLPRKSVFEMSVEELRERVRPTAEQIKKEAWDKNSYITYFDEELCPSAGFIVHEYQDRKELVRIKQNGETQLIKIL